MEKNFEKILIGGLYDCEENIDDPENVSRTLKEAAKLMQVEPVEECYHKYEPYGLTYTIIIKESIITFSSYPENKSVLLYLSSCNPDSNLKEAFEYVARKFKSRETKIFFNHSLPLRIKDV
ncbi:MAG: S-adenosylmethionine decarboxylase [Candidatus Aenigmatarchaeota archaeon]